VLTRQSKLVICGLALACLATPAGAATPGNTASTEKPPIYTFLIQSGFSKSAHPEAAVVRGTITVNRNGQNVPTSTVRTLSRQHQPETLNAIQAAIVNGTVVEECETSKIGSLEVSYSNGKVLTVVIYGAYFEITTSAGTIRFTSEALSKILLELLK